jgi:hypothetical protein
MALVKLTSRIISLFHMYVPDVKICTVSCLEDEKESKCFKQREIESGRKNPPGR